MKAEDIMTTEVVSVPSTMSIVDAAAIIAEHNVDGVPVVDSTGKLEGILTEYDLISKGSAVHLPTFITILENLAVYKKDHSKFKKEVSELSKLEAKDLMNQDPLTLSKNASYAEVVEAFRDHHRVNPIPVVDENNKVVGVISRYDVLKPLHP